MMTATTKSRAVKIPSHSRVNGWSRPPHFAQFAAWLAVVYLLLYSYGVLAPAFVHSIQNFVYTTVTVIFIVHILFHIIATSINPAEPSVKEKQDKGDQNVTELDRSKHEKVIENNFCNVCQVPVSSKAKHCRQCNKCIYSFDHHCLWLNNCVGESNYRYFITTLASSFVGLLLISILTIVQMVAAFTDEGKGNILLCYHSAGKNDTSDATVYLMFNHQVFYEGWYAMLSITLIIVLTGVGSIGHLLGFHLILCYYHVSTYHYLNSGGVRSQTTNAIVNASHNNSLDIFTGDSSGESVRSSSTILIGSKCNLTGAISDDGVTIKGVCPKIAWESESDLGSCDSKYHHGHYCRHGLRAGLSAVPFWHRSGRAVTMHSAPSTSAVRHQLDECSHNASVLSYMRALSQTLPGAVVTVASGYANVNTNARTAKDTASVHTIGKCNHNVPMQSCTGSSSHHTNSEAVVNVLGYYSNVNTNAQPDDDVVSMHSSELDEEITTNWSSSRDVFDEADYMAKHKVEGPVKTYRRPSNNRMDSSEAAIVSSSDAKIKALIELEDQLRSGTGNKKSKDTDPTVADKSSAGGICQCCSPKNRSNKVEPQVNQRESVKNSAAKETAVKNKASIPVPRAVSSEKIIKKIQVMDEEKSNKETAVTPDHKPSQDRPAANLDIMKRGHSVLDCKLFADDPRCLKLGKKTSKLAVDNEAQTKDEAPPSDEQPKNDVTAGDDGAGDGGALGLQRSVSMFDCKLFVDDHRCKKPVKFDTHLTVGGTAHNSPRKTPEISVTIDHETKPKTDVLKSTAEHSSPEPKTDVLMASVEGSGLDQVNASDTIENSLGVPVCRSNMDCSLLDYLAKMPAPKKQ